MYQGVIIKETLTDELFLDNLVIERAKISSKQPNETIQYWTMIFFHSEVENLPQLLSETIIDGWFADMKAENTKIIVFRNKVLQYEIGNELEKEAVLNYMRELGIPDNQFNWDE